jgi:uncharacterized membrane protein
MTVLLTLMLIVGGVILFDARGRVKRLEDRLARVEAELRKGGGAASLVPPREREVRETMPEPVASVETQGAPGAIDDRPVTVAPPPVPEREAALAASAVPAVPPPVSTAPATPVPASSRLSINFEELFGRRLPIWAGGITLAIAGVLIVKYAIDIGLFGRIFTPGVQAVCGLLFGLGLIGGAELAHRKRDRVDDPRVAQALAGAGISTLYAAVLVAANAYHLLGPIAAFIGLAIITAAALGLSLRHGAPSALLGLAGGLAAPALTVGITANVPLLAIYMALTIAGLVGVARARRWPWLALIALIGGAGWSLWLILAGEALTLLGSLSVGMFVLLLAIAAPLFAFEGVRATLLRSVAAVVGAAQLALLVALGGFAPLDWGLFALIAAAGQWLAWRDDKLAIIPTVGAALSVLLLLGWPDPAPGWLLAIGLLLGAIHILPLLARLWREPARVQRAVELSAIAVAVPIVALRHFFGDATVVGLAATAGALPVLAGAALGWKIEARASDSRFAWLVATAAGLLVYASWCALAPWQAPLSAAVAAAFLLWLARPARDWRIEAVAAAYGVLAILVLLGTMRDFSELEALVSGVQAIGVPSLLRWAALTAMAAFFAWRADRRVIGETGGFVAAMLAYGTVAQLLPAWLLPLAAPIGLGALALATREAAWPRLRTAALAFALLVAGWAFVPLVYWINAALLSLVGVPMRILAPVLATGEVARRLLIPALLLGFAVWRLRARLSRATTLATGALVASLGIVAVHCLYRMGFAALFGSDFTHTGIAERLLWSGLVGGVGFVLWKRAGGLLAGYLPPALVGIGAAHLLWYSLLLHNPLWSDQAVGPVPLANLLLPLFAALPLALWLLAAMRPAIATVIDKALQPAIMVMIALFAWASLRQAFHGSLLTAPGVGSAEDILRSILGIVLAIGYLLWGIRTHRRDWRVASLVLMLAAVAKVFLFDASGLEGLLRIASFVALGFSLIGIGWLYSRQLTRESAQPSV